MEKEILKLLFKSDTALSFTEIKKALGITTSKKEGSLKKTLKEMAYNQDIREINNRYTKAEWTSLGTGIISVNKAGNAFIDNKKESVFIPAENRNHAFDGDEVEYFFNDFDNEGIVLKILNHAHKYVAGTITRKKHNYILVPDDPKIPGSFTITNEASFPLKTKQKATAKIRSYDYPLSCELVKILGNMHDPKVIVEAMMANHEVFAEFPDEVGEQVLQLPKKVLKKELKKRKDLSNTLHVTIDGEDAKDFDDAVYLVKDNEDYLLYVSIADVSHYVLEDSPIDKEAYTRGTSVYLADRVIPMLPEELCNNMCSLVPEQLRLTLTCEIRTDKEGNVTDYSIYPSYIYSHYRLTYTEVNEYLEGKKELLKDDMELSEMISAMKELSEIIRKKRNKEGAISFETAETRILLDDDYNVINVYPKTRSYGELLIEDFMILANNCVANKMNSLNIPAVYRVHDAPSLRKIYSFMDLCDSLGTKWIYDAENVTSHDYQDLLQRAENNPNKDILSLMAIRSMAKAEYSDNCKGHFGLALKEYLHFTSPIRRYPDLVVHRMLRKYLFEENVIDDKDYNTVSQAAVQSSFKERNADALERETDNFQMSRYMKNYIGQKFTATVTSVGRQGLYITLDNGIEGLVTLSNLSDDFYIYNEYRYTLSGRRHGKTYRLGQKLNVVCQGISEDYTVIFMVK